MSDQGASPKTSQKPRLISAGDVIFREGDVGDCAYLIERGRVLVYLTGDDQSEIPLKVLEEGEVFGEMSLIDNSMRSASCRAIGECLLLVVTKDQLLDRIRVADPVVRLLMQALLERLRTQNDLLRGKSTLQTGRIDSLSEERKEALERIELETRIADGLKNDEFVPYFQPIYDLNTGELRGCEALLRWISKDKGIISPAVFMDALEESSLILSAGRMVIEKAMASLAVMRSTFKGHDDFFVSINVSGRQFSDPQFLEHLESCRARHKLERRHIKLELTERIMTESLHAMSMLHQTRGLGYNLAIDDFGTGFSSLQYLANMPLTDLKIDRIFVMTMLSDPKSLSITKSLISMASNLGLNLIAEGIETTHELAMLKSLNVEMGQGFLFSKAIPLQDFVKLGARTQSKAA